MKRTCGDAARVLGGVAGGAGCGAWSCCCCCLLSVPSLWTGSTLSSCVPSLTFGDESTTATVARCGSGCGTCGSCGCGVVPSSSSMCTLSMVWALLYAVLPVAADSLLVQATPRRAATTAGMLWAPAVRRPQASLSLEDVVACFPVLL